MNRPQIASRFFSLATTAFLMSCSSSSGVSKIRPPGPDDMPVSTLTEGGAVTLGFSGSTIRQSTSVSSIRLTEVPITVGEFRGCVEAGACSPPSLPSLSCRSPREASPLAGATFGMKQDQLPVTCATFIEASSYCSWVGGRLPSLAEWLHAARGPEPAPYSWGDDPPSCAKHPRFFDVDGSCSDLAGDNAQQLLFQVRNHPDGKSPSGAQDILSGSAELVHDSRESSLLCNARTSPCLVLGGRAGEIMGVQSVPELRDIQLSTYAAPLFTFRCAWEASR